MDDITSFGEVDSGDDSNLTPIINRTPLLTQESRPDDVLHEIPEDAEEDHGAALLVEPTQV
jgi:hypothetical protein